jgi:diguanylate cyclase (GGDEF)-like protein
MLIAWAACAAAWTEPATTEGEEREAVPAVPQIATFWRSLVPYALVPMVGVLLVYTMNSPGDARLKGGVYVSAGALIGIILLRQVLALWENRSLYRLLDTAYQELDGKSRKTTEYAQSLERVNRELHAMRQELEAQNESLAEANAKLEALATTDGMTGLANHRAFQGRLRTEMARAERHGTPLALLLLDVDHFKRYNDTYGHPAGDDVLCTVGRLMREAVREGDLAARYGGEEFAVLLPATDVESALAIAERIRAAVAAYPFPHADVTLSAGVTDVTIVGSDDPEDLVGSADAALYAAKRAGRNRVVVAAGAEGGGPVLSRAA